MFIAALSTVDKIWKQPEYPSMDKKDVLYAHICSHYSVMRTKDILLPASTQMDIEGITLSEIRQTEINAV